MSAVSESMNRRMTLGHLASQYGFDLDPSFASEVTVTSLADDIDSIRPGALFVPGADVDVRQLVQAQQLGAYGAIVPHAMRGEIQDLQIPLIYAEPTAQQLGKLACDIAGAPSDVLAVFAIVGSDRESVEADVKDLADFLHMLGNPVGVISAANSQSLERFLDLHYPLSILDVQRTLAVCAEDGAAAVILALDERTLRKQALQSVSIDVLGVMMPESAKRNCRGTWQASAVRSASRRMWPRVRRSPICWHRRPRWHTSRSMAGRCRCRSPWFWRPAYVKRTSRARYACQGT